MEQIRTKLEQYRSADLMESDPDSLVDLCDVRIDTSRPVRERMESFIRQVDNPYLFKVDGLIIKTVYPSNAVRRLADRLVNC